MSFPSAALELQRRLADRWGQEKRLGKPFAVYQNIMRFKRFGRLKPEALPFSE